MGVRPFLTLRVYAVPRARQEGRGLAQTAVSENRKGRHAAYIVVGYQHDLAGHVDGHVAGAGTAGWNGIQQGQFACPVVNGEGADAAGLLSAVIGDFIDRVKVTVARIDREEGRAGCLRRQTERRKLSRGRGKPINVDPLAVRAQYRCRCKQDN